MKQQNCKIHKLYYKKLAALGFGSIDLSRIVQESAFQPKMFKNHLFLVKTLEQMSWISILVSIVICNEE